MSRWVPDATKKSIVLVQCHRHGRKYWWGTLLRGWAHHRRALSSMATMVVRSWSGFCGFHPWISGFWVGCSGLAGWIGCRDGGTGWIRWPPLCAMFLNKLPYFKFQIKLTNKIAAVLLCILNLTHLKRISLVWVMAWYRRGDKPLPEPKITKVTIPVGVALDVSGSPYRISMWLSEISRAASTGRIHRMPYGAARPKRVNGHPPWA